MPQSEKAKTAGKFIVIMLCFAILFFLLLPFLEDPSQAAAAQGKKASPQIFTSNPLSDLVRKVYAMFKKHNPQAAPQQTADATAYANEFLTVPEGADLPLYAAAPAGEGQAAPGAPAQDAQPQGRAATYTPQGYDEYGEAGFVNEDGQWVLVRQTAPDAAQRGMHDINASDSAYDKLMRLQRAAKYAPAQTPDEQTIPDSKWARLFRPIKKFFGAKEQGNASAYQLASASDYGRSRQNKRPDSMPRRQAITDLPAANISASAPLLDGQESLFDLLNPGDFLEEMTNNLEESADNMLEGKERNDFKKFIRGRKAQRLQMVRQQLQQNILQDAQGQPATDFISKTNLCGSGGISPFYSQEDLGCELIDFQTPQEKEQAKKAKEQQAQENRKRSLEILNQKAGHTLNPKDLKMMVLLGKTEDINPMQNLSRAPFPYEEDSPEQEQIKAENEKRARQDKTLQEFYEYMLQQQGCQSQPCYWVATEVQTEKPDVRLTVESAGMEFLGDPLGVQQKLTEGFIAQKMSDENTDWEHLQHDLSEYNAYYIPYNKENMDELNKKNMPQGRNQKPQDAFMIFVPSAANAADLLQSNVLPNPGVVIYDDNKAQTLEKYSQYNSLAERGDHIRDLVLQRAETTKDLMKKQSKGLAQEAYSEIMSKSGNSLRQKLAGEKMSEIEASMGLTK